MKMEIQIFNSLSPIRNYQSRFIFIQLIRKSFPKLVSITTHSKGGIDQLSGDVQNEDMKKR